MGSHQAKPNNFTIPPFKRVHLQKPSSSVTDTKSLQSIQGTATRYITRGLHGTAYNVMEAHADLPPINLLLRKIQFRAASRICTLPPRHPLYPIACHAAARFVKSHHSPLHYIFFITGLKPQNTKMIDPVCRHFTYKPALKMIIGLDKESALMAVDVNYASTPYKIYCNGSGFKGGAGALAILYKGNHPVKSLHYHLGPLTTHTVYGSKLIGLLLTLHILLGLTCQLPHTVIIGLDN